MTEETKTERARRLATERKRAQRERERQHREKMQAHEVRLELYQGTTQALEKVCKKGGFEEPAEAITLLIHNAAELAERDPSRFAELTKVRCHA